jgi:hypothetical protein
MYGLFKRNGFEQYILYDMLTSRLKLECQGAPII